VENGLEYNRNINVSERARRLVDNIVHALNVVAPKKQFKIPRISERKRWFTEEIRDAAARRGETYRKALDEDGTELVVL